jgi:hypothetical protein
LEACPFPSVFTESRLRFDVAIEGMGSILMLGKA